MSIENFLTLIEFNRMAQLERPLEIAHVFHYEIYVKSVKCLKKRRRSASVFEIDNAFFRGGTSKTVKLHSDMRCILSFLCEYRVSIYFRMVTIQFNYLTNWIWVPYQNLMKILLILETKVTNKLFIRSIFPANLF